VLLCVGFLAGCGTSLNNGAAGDFAATDSAPQASVGPHGASGYRIGALDVLDVSVFKVPELSRSVQVANVGTINLPLVGEIRAAGMTAQELERDLTKRLAAKYLRQPQVTIYVKEYNSQRVTVEGEVKKPGVYPIKGSGSLLQLIAMAEGPGPLADSTVLVIRQNDGKRMAARFDLSAIRNGETEDPHIQSGDTIVVGISAIKQTGDYILKILPAMGVFALLL
jgi:polysaccharide biosynthesis/export protein